MNLPWWEWEEMQAAIQERPDLWQEHPDWPNSYFRVASDQPCYLLQALSPPGAGEFRQVKLVTKPISWSPDEVEGHLIYMREKFTSHPFRKDVEAFLKDDIKLDPTLAYKASIVIGRMQQGPLSNGSTANVAEPEKPFTRFHLREGGIVQFRQQGGMLRCHMEITQYNTQRSINGGYVLILDGFMRPRGTLLSNVVDFLTGDMFLKMSEEVDLRPDTVQPRLEENNADPGL